MTNRRLFVCITDRVPTIIRYISLVTLVCLALIAAYPISRISDASAQSSTIHRRANVPDSTEVPAVLHSQLPDSKVAPTNNVNLVSGKWYTFTGPDGDFSLEFPGKPSSKEAVQGPLTLVRSFDLTTAKGMWFSVNFQDNGGDPWASDNNEWAPDLEQLSSAADRKEGRRVVQIHRLAKNIVQTELWQTVPETGTNINYLRRSILWRGRVYTLACGWVINDRQVDKPTCDRFFNSMQFITRPRRQAQRRLK